MRHRSKVNPLGRKAPHRKAMLANMACSLIRHKRISTTVAKAKALRVYVEPIITRSKTDSTHSRRMVFRKLQSKHAVSELFREVAPKVAERRGGYTRILKTGTRAGDAAEICFIELVDFNDAYLQAKEAKPAKARKSRRAGRKKSDTKSEAMLKHGEAGQPESEAQDTKTAAVAEKGSDSQEIPEKKSRPEDKNNNEEEKKDE